MRSLCFTILAVGALLAVGCAGSTGDGAPQAGFNPAPGGSQAGNDSAAAPDFTLSTIDGAEFRLADSSGRVRLLDFWATWCAPCREEIPMLKQLHEDYQELGLDIVAISDEDTDVVREFVRDQGIEYANLIDPGDVAEEYSVLGLPTGFLIDRDGRVVDQFVGPKPAKVLERRIRELLELPAG